MEREGWKMGNVQMRRVTLRTAPAAAYDPDRVAEPSPVFDPSLLQSRGFMSAIVGWLVKHPLWLMAFLRRFRPIATFRNWAIITRYDDVAEALQNDKVFATPFGAKIKMLNAGPNFLLGMPDDADYRWLHKETVNVFRRDDLTRLIGPIAREEASKLIASSQGRIDAVRDLITLVPTRICERYY